MFKITTDNYSDEVPVLPECRIVAQLLIKFPAFVEHVGSLPCEQQPATGAVHTLQPNLFNMNIKGPHTHNFPLSFLKKFYMYFLCRIHAACYIINPYHTPCLHHTNNFWWEVQTMPLLIMPFSLPSCNFHPLTSKYSKQISSQFFHDVTCISFHSSFIH